MTRVLPNGYSWSPWTDARESAAHKLWLTGMSCAAVGRAIAEPGFRPTRNAIIGLAHRRGWIREARQQPAKPMRAPVVRQTRQAAGASAAALVLRAKAARVTISALTGLPSGPRSKPVQSAKRGPVPLLCEPVALLDLTSTSCRYPVSGEGADTLFCGYPTEAAYCPGHAAICWTGIPERKTPTTPLPKGMAA